MTLDYATSLRVSDAPEGMFARVLRYDVRGVEVHRDPDKPLRDEVRRAMKVRAERIACDLPADTPAETGSLRVLECFRYPQRGGAYVDTECTRCGRTNVRDLRRWRDAVRAGVECCAKCTRRLVRVGEFGK